MAKYKIADLIIEFSPQYEYTRDLCRDYITDTDAPADICVKPAMDYAYEAQYLPDQPVHGLESMDIYRQICTALVDYDGFLLHSSAIMAEGQGYLFTAPSGTGKSTHTKLWRKCFGADKVTVINDDKPIVRKCDGAFHVYGTPWCGKHGLNTDIHCPIKGVCFIKRGTENSIRKVSKDEIIMPLLNQIHRANDPHYMDKLLSLVDEFLDSVSFYELHCDISPMAVKTSYEAMSGKKVKYK